MTDPSEAARGKSILQSSGFAIPPFLVLGLPRSRTFWLSRFLSYGGWDCGHDQLVRMRGLDDVKSWAATPMVGSVETAAAPWWRLGKRLIPGLRLVIVRRSPEAVLDSLERIEGLSFDVDLMLKNLRNQATKLDQVARRWPGALVLNYHQLNDEDACARLFQHCLCIQHEPAWWAAASAANLQINFPALVRYMQGNAGQLERFAKSAKQEQLTAFALRGRGRLGQVRFGEEAFPTFRIEAKKLVAAHMESVGLPSDPGLTRDMDLMDGLDADARLSTMVARVAGKPVGYLVSVISPSVELKGQLEAAMLIIYASPRFPGLGARLARKALRTLRDRGVVRIIMRAGVRGDGPRLGKLFQALGAEPAGQMFKLDFPEGV